MCLAARIQKKLSPGGRGCGGKKPPLVLPASGGRQGTAPPQVVWGKKNFRMLSQLSRVAREPPHHRWRQTGWYLPPSSVGVNRRFSEHQRRKPPPHRGQSPLWKNAAIQAVPVARAPAPHFPQVVDRGRAGILQWRKQRRTKGEWSHEAGTDRTRTLRLRQ